MTDGDISFTKQDRHRSRQSRQGNLENSDDDKDSISLEIESDSDEDQDIEDSRREKRQTSAKHNQKRSSMVRPFERMQAVNCNEIKLFRMESAVRDLQGDPARTSLVAPREAARSCSKHERSGLMSHK
jgi:hypothetical protein